MPYEERRCLVHLKIVPQQKRAHNWRSPSYTAVAAAAAAVTAATANFSNLNNAYFSL
jgi:hypothetical protein